MKDATIKTEVSKEKYRELSDFFAVVPEAEVYDHFAVFHDGGYIKAVRSGGDPGIIFIEMSGPEKETVEPWSPPVARKGDPT